MNIIDKKIKLWERKYAFDKIRLKNQFVFNLDTFSPKTILKKTVSNYFNQSKLKKVSSAIVFCLFVYKIFKRKVKPILSL